MRKKKDYLEHTKRPPEKFIKILLRDGVIEHESELGQLTRRMLLQKYLENIEDTVCEAIADSVFSGLSRSESSLCGADFVR